MRLLKLVLQDFKNYSALDAVFSGTINFFTGKNGAGKTNLMDAIHYLSTARGFVNPTETHTIREGAETASVKGIFLSDDGREHEVIVRLSGNRKEILEDGVSCEKLSQHIGKFPVVVIAPGDHELISGGSEERRKYFDGLLSQTNPSYLQHLVAYHKLLKQRNAALKLWEGRSPDDSLLDVYDTGLALHGDVIYTVRKEFIEDFAGFLSQAHQYLTEAPEAVDLLYQSELDNGDFYRLLKINTQRDCYLQRTTIGIHRDDFLFQMGEYPLKRRGSQGQQKSFLIALKLAQFDWVMKKNGFKPLLLMDDIFDKLDDTRIMRLLQKIEESYFGQLFLTDARGSAFRKHLTDAAIGARFFEVNNGKLKADGQG